MKLLVFALAVSAVYANTFISGTTYKPSCQKKVFCDSKLLHYVQMAKIFPDSKTFVDLHMKYDEKTIMSAFDKLLVKTQNRPTKEKLSEFVNLHFDSESGLDAWTPSDYVAEPAFIASIRDPQLRQFAQNINNNWPILGRKIKPVVFENPESFSMIPVNNGFIIPGGKFNEFYYWDSYWIVQALLMSGMKDTAKGMISNLIELQREFGYIPSGNRYYYQGRSQPPLLSAMMAIYIQETNDVEFLKANIDAVESELEYWLDTHSVVFNVAGREYSLLRYFSPSAGPRPESYYEDYTNAQAFESEQRQKQFYTEINSGAESGWVFSSRWLVDRNGSNTGNLTSIHTTDIVPVDLNAIFASALQNVYHFRSLLNDNRKGAHYLEMRNKWINSIKEVLWNEEDGMWYDFNLQNSQQRKYFYISNIAPLWMGVVEPEFMRAKSQKILNYMRKNHVLEYPGGVPTSLTHSGQQWDLPYAWPSQVSMIVSALEALETKESTKMAFEVAQTMVNSIYKGYLSNKQLYEKYDVESPGKVGGSGEYIGQDGFGWTNSIVVEMLAKYGATMAVVKGYVPFFSQFPQYSHASHAIVPQQSVFNQQHYSLSYPSKPFGSAAQPEFVAKVPTHSVYFSPAPAKPSIAPAVFTQSAYLPSYPTKPVYVSSAKPTHVLPAQVKPEYTLSIKEKPEYLTTVKPEFESSTPFDYEIDSSTTLKPEYTTSYPDKPLYDSPVENKPQYTLGATPEYFAPAPVKPEYISSTKSKPELVSAGYNKPSYVASAPVKPEYIPSTESKPELVSAVHNKPSYVASAPVKPEYIPSSESKPELVSAGYNKPSYVASAPVKPEYIPSTESKPELVSAVHNKPSYEASAPVKPEYIPSTESKPELVSVVHNKPSYVASAPVKPEYVPSTESKPELVSAVYNKPSYVASAPVKAEYIPSAESKPELVSTVYNKPSYVASAPVKPEYTPSAESKPELVSAGYNKPSYVASAPVKPEYIPSTESKPELVSAVHNKPSYVASAPVKPEYIPSTESKLELVSAVHNKPSYVASAPVKPEYILSTESKPELVSAGYNKPSHVASAPVKPEYVPSTEFKPESVSAVYNKPSYVASAPVKAEYIPSAESKPELVSTVYNKPSYVASAPVKPEYIPSAESKPQLVSSVYNKPSYVASAPVKPEYIPATQSKPELVSADYTKPEYVSHDEAKPDFVSYTPSESEYVPTTSAKPEYVTSSPSKPSFVSAFETKPQYVKHEYVPSTEVKPGYGFVAQTKPELVSAAHIKPSSLSYAEIKPQYTSSAEPKPELISSTTYEPEYVPTTTFKPEQVTLYPAKPTYVSFFEHRPQYTSPAKPGYVVSAQIKPEYTPSTLKPEVKPQYLHFQVKPQNVPSAHLDLVPSVEPKPEYVPTTDAKPTILPTKEVYVQSTPIKQTFTSQPLFTSYSPVKPLVAPTKPAFVSSAAPHAAPPRVSFGSTYVKPSYSVSIASESKYTTPYPVSTEYEASSVTEAEYTTLAPAEYTTSASFKPEYTTAIESEYSSTTPQNELEYTTTQSHYVDSTLAPVKATEQTPVKPGYGYFVSAQAKPQVNAVTFNNLPSTVKPHYAVEFSTFAPQTEEVLKFTSTYAASAPTKFPSLTEVKPSFTVSLPAKPLVPQSADYTAAQQQATVLQQSHYSYVPEYNVNKPALPIVTGTSPKSEGFSSISQIKLNSTSANSAFGFNKFTHSVTAKPEYSSIATSGSGFVFNKTVTPSLVSSSVEVSGAPVKTGQSVFGYSTFSKPSLVQSGQYVHSGKWQDSTQVKPTFGVTTNKHSYYTSSPFQHSKFNSGQYQTHYNLGQYQPQFNSGLYKSSYVKPAVIKPVTSPTIHV